MRTGRTYWPMVLVVPLGLVGFTTYAAPADDQQLHMLSGVIVQKSDGTPLAGIQVVMAHGEKGYLEIGPRGRLDGRGEADEQPHVFAQRNAKFFCDAFTDDQGRFTLRGFAAPDEEWNLAAGDGARGLVLQRRVIPSAYADKPLLIEIDSPADIIVQPPPPPADKSLEGSVGVALAPIAARPPGAEAADSPPDRAREPNATGESKIGFYASWRSDEDQDSPWHLGPFPPGFTYRITSYLYGRRLGYNPTLFERTVSLTPGVAATISLDSKDGGALSGRITDIEDKALADVNVMAKTRDGSGLVIGTLSDAEGRYVLSGVPPGTHTLELLRHVARTAPT